MSTIPSDALKRLLKHAKSDSLDTLDVSLHEQGSWPESRHRASQQALTSLIAACGSGRPLLIRGEPGVGKSHLARAAAVLMERHFISVVIQPHSEYQDLLWSFDHTARLGEAQLLARVDQTDAKQALAAKNFITPGPLWWALDYKGKKPESRHAYQPEPEVKGFTADQGIVILIDEIDKADISLCNGLLEVLGNGSFTVPHWSETVVGNRNNPPLVVITSNDTRQLPSAFLRRCVILDLKLPRGDALVKHLATIGKVHFRDMDDSVLTQAADQIVADRESGSELARTGQAEYLDLLRTLNNIDSDKEIQQHWLKQLRQCFRKTAERS